MIKEVTGDILLTGAMVIAQGVAPNDHFDSGLALSLRENFPDMYKDFRHYCFQSNPKAGKAWYWGKSDVVKIVNLLTQEPAIGKQGHPGKATLSYVSRSLKELVKIIKKEKISSVALPRLATGVGGLDWEDVGPLMYERLSDLDIPIYIYTTYAKDIKADEN